MFLRQVFDPALAAYLSGRGPEEWRYGWAEGRNDVRRAAEFAEHSVPGSINIAYTRLAANRDQIPNTKLIVHCESGKRAAFAAAYLERFGSDVIFADGDYEDWKRAST